MGLIRGITAVLLSITLSFTTFSVAGAELTDETVVKVLITELQTESLDSANEEFIELTNISSSSVLLDGWTVQYRSATGTSWQDKTLLSGVLYAGSSIVISTQGYLTDNSTFFWSSVDGQLAATGGNIRVMATNTVEAEDTLAWGTGIFGENLAATKATKGKSLHRKFIDGQFVDTNTNNADFFEDQPDPINKNIAPEPSPDVTDPNVIEEMPPLPDLPPAEEITQPGEEQVDQPPQDEDPVVADETPPTESTNEQPSADGDVPPIATTRSSLEPIIINELMINPSSPLLDSSDEWIELYNPNSEPYELKDYKIQTGSSYSYSYIFTNEKLQPFGYLVLNSSDSSLALSNTAGSVRMLDENGLVIGSTVSYVDVEEGNSYALDGSGTWRWTTTPTLGTFNLITEAPIIIKTAVLTTKKPTTPKSSSAKASTTKKSTSKATATKASAKTSAKKASSNTGVVGDVAAISDFQEPKTRPLLLAILALLAVLYGLYEYRDDISNSLWKTRRYIEAWRKNRQSL